LEIDNKKKRKTVETKRGIRRQKKMKGVKKEERVMGG